MNPHVRSAAFAALRPGTLAMVLALRLSAQSPATTTPVPALLDTVVVTGQALAIQRSAEVKQNAETILDSVSADDIGKLPDHNTAAALRRIPGVSVQEDQMEYRWPIIRGLNAGYNSTTIDGAAVASPDYSGNRDVPLDVIPSALAKRIEVRKTVTPDMDHNALGGSIDIVTQSAFDFQGPFAIATGSWADYAMKGHVRPAKASWRGNLVAGSTGGAVEKPTFGLIATANFQRRHSDIPQIEGGAGLLEYNAAGAPVTLGTGNGFLVPPQRRLFWYDNIRERSGGSLAFEWRPHNRVRLEVGGSYNKIHDDERRDENRYEQVGNVTGQTATSGTFAQGRNIVGLGRFTIDRATWGGNAKLNWRPNRDTTWDTRVSWSAAEANNPESQEEFRTGTTVGFSYVYNDFFPTLTPTNPAAFNTLTNYAFQSRSTLLRHSEEDVLNAKSDLSHKTTLAGLPVTYKVGVLARRTVRDNDQDSTSFTYTSATPYTLAQVAQPGPDYTLQGGYRFLALIDSQAAWDFAGTNANRFTTTPNNLQSDYVVTEKIGAAYAMATVILDKLKLIGGVRGERSTIESDFFRTVGTVLTPSALEATFSQLLPDLNASYRVTDRFLVRGAVTQTYGRPRFGSLAGRENVSFASTIPTVSRGNPGLKPRESNNYDLSFEYYLKHGAAALAVFAKDVKQEIFTRTTTEQLDVGRGVEPVTITQPQNAETGKLRGLELSLSQTFAFLPAPFNGLGASVNTTWIDGEFRSLSGTGIRTTSYAQQPERTSNATVFYALGNFDARLSWNYIGRFLDTLSASPATDQYWQFREQYDLRLGYRIARRYTVFLELENLTERGRRELIGPNADRLQEDAHYGRVIWAGLTTKF